MLNFNIYFNYRIKKGNTPPLTGIHHPYLKSITTSKFYHIQHNSTTIFSSFTELLQRIPQIFLQESLHQIGIPPWYQLQNYKLLQYSYLDQLPNTP